MLLQRLCELESRNSTRVGSDEEEVPSEYTERNIPWLIWLTPDGSHADFVRTSGGASKRKDLGKQMQVPLLKRSGTKIKPQLLADTPEFVLGVPVKDDPERAKSRFADFLALTRACALATRVEEIEAIVRFLEGLTNHPLQPPSDLQPSDWITFQVGKVRPVELEPVQKFWAEVAPHLGQRGVSDLTPELILSWLTQEVSENIGQCLVCGEVRPIARVHPVPIRLPRAVAEKQLAMVSANREAFYSYGLEQSLIAPTCRPCAQAYARALNRLASDVRSRVVLGNAVFVFWTREDVGFDLLSFVESPQPETVHNLLTSVYSGHSPTDVDSTAFYAATLSASGARPVIRDWIDTTVEQVQRRLAQWFQRQAIVDAYGEAPEPLGLGSLAGATVRELSDVTPPTMRALLRAALVGTPLPLDLLYPAVQRNRAEAGNRKVRDRPVTHGRAALIKLVMLSQYPDLQETIMPHLNPDNPSPAYQCGRLLAVLEQAQRQAIPDLNATIVDRFYGAASTAPSTVFGLLLEGVQAHLSKLRRENKGASSEALQAQLQDVLDRLDAFPRTLNLPEQAVFALGYYHQRAFDRARARAAGAQRKRAAQDEAATSGPATD